MRRASGEAGRRAQSLTGLLDTNIFYCISWYKVDNKFPADQTASMHQHRVGCSAQTSECCWCPRHATRIPQRRLYIRQAAKTCLLQEYGFNVSSDACSRDERWMHPTGCFRRCVLAGGKRESNYQSDASDSAVFHERHY